VGTVADVQQVAPKRRQQYPHSHMQIRNSRININKDGALSWQDTDVIRIQDAGYRMQDAILNHSRRLISLQLALLRFVLNVFLPPPS
jgi:hypothetical protein